MPAAFLASALIQFALGLVAAWLLGPVEFGYYALALAAAVLTQTLAFEWLRLGATRFHHKDASPDFEAALIRSFKRLSVVLLGVTLLLAAFGGERRILLALVPLTAIAAGYADLRAAMLRSEFESGGYALFLALRNGFALVALPIAAALSGRAEPTLGAFLLALVLASSLLAWRMHGKHRAGWAQPSASPPLRDVMAYSIPIVATNLAYLGLFFLIRIAIAWAGGMAASGQASLALDFTLKLFTTAGTAFDLLFFQLAVRDGRERGEVAGQARVRQNFERLLVMIAPMAVGLAFVIARIEPLFVAPEFRGAFAGFVLAATPGVAAYALVQYGLHPVFQLRQETARLVTAALVAGMSGSAVLAVVIVSGGSALIALGGAVLFAMAGASAVLMRGVPFEFLPGGRFWFLLFIALAGMSLFLFAVGRLGEGAGVLAAMLAAGITSYGALIWVVNLGDVRALRRGPT